MSYDFNSRLRRALHQRIYLIRAEKTRTAHNFVVMGSTDTEYSVSIDNYISCQCPDHVFSRKLCKHLIFVLIKVLKHTEPFLQHNYVGTHFKTNETTLERCSVFFVSYNGTDTFANDNESPHTIIEQQPVVPQRPITDEDMCPVCFESMLDPKLVVYCKRSCGKSLHTECYTKWSKASQKKNCVYCRATF